MNGARSGFTEAARHVTMHLNGKGTRLGVYDERRVKIVATLGPASAGRETLATLFEAGVDVVRINAAHGSPDDRARMIEDVRAISAELGRMVPILFDLRGLKIRTGPLAGSEKIPVARGSKIEVVNTPEPTTGDPHRDRFPRVVRCRFSSAPGFSFPTA